jgi:hypothetical protein
MNQTPEQPRLTPSARRATLLAAAVSMAAGLALGSTIGPVAFGQPAAPTQTDEVEPIDQDPIEPRRIIDIEVQMATAPDLPTYIYRLWSDGTIEMASSAYPPDRFTDWKPLPEN